MQHTMSAITAVVLAAFVGYAGAWYTGAVEGNFALLLLLATVVTGVYWVAEKLVFLPRRKAEAQRMLDEHNSRKEALLKQGFSQVEGDVEPARQRLLMQPWWLDWTAGLFPVILAVFVLRSFLFEPFKIPSGSMIPTLRVGDLILVNKFHYGVRLPVINTKIIANHEPQRGDVMVFRYPPQPSLDYIKRVIGVPGDEIAYLNKRLTINGKPVPTSALLEQSTPVEAPPAGQKAADAQAVLSSGIQDISNSLVEDFKLNDVLRIILETMYRAMGFKRVLLCIRDGRSNSMTGRFGFGPEVGELAKHVRFSLSAHPDNVFNVATAKGVDILISDIDDPKIASRVPTWYRKSVPSRTFCLFPLMIKGRPVAKSTPTRIARARSVSASRNSPCCAPCATRRCWPSSRSAEAARRAQNTCHQGFFFSSPWV